MRSLWAPKSQGPRTNKPNPPPPSGAARRVRGIRPGPTDDVVLGRRRTDAEYATREIGAACRPRRLLSSHAHRAPLVPQSARGVEDQPTADEATIDEDTRCSGVRPCVRCRWLPARRCTGTAAAAACLLDGLMLATDCPSP